MAEENKMQFDDEVKALIIETLSGNKTGGGDIDGLFRLKDGFVVIEFLRCVSVPPFTSHPNFYWNYNNLDKRGNKIKFITLWNISQKTKSKLFLINYEDSRVQFKIIEVLNIDENKGIIEENVTRMNFEEFKKWFNALIDASV
jgi:hypothetical protein